jgi:hypothetical protein
VIKCTRAALKVPTPPTGGRHLQAVGKGGAVLGDSKEDVAACLVPRAGVLRVERVVQANCLRALCAAYIFLLGIFAQL